MYNIKILKTAHINCANSVVFLNGNSQEYTKIGCHAFLLEKEGKYYLIDTGIEDIDTANKTKSSKDDWARDDSEHSVKDSLELLGIDAEKVSKVFLTHSHYDHISGIIHFPNAEIYMAKKEYDFLFSEENPLKEYLENAKAFIRDKNPVLVDDELVADGIRLKLRGGHTAGSMSIEVEDHLFVGDTIFTRTNLEKRIPAGFTADKSRSEELIGIYAEYKGKIVTSHDYKEKI